MFYVIMKFILCHELYIVINFHNLYINLMFYVIMKFKNHILCHELYIT